MALEFHTTDYEWSHGRTPRGRGSWAFGLTRHADACGPDCLWSPSLTYGEAKKWAAAQVRARFGADASGTLYVLP